MAGLGKGHTYDNWHPTRKYFPSPGKDIDFGLETLGEFQEMFSNEYFYQFDTFISELLCLQIEADHATPTIPPASTNPNQ